MKRPGDVVVVQFPFSDLTQAKMRPALLLGKLPGIHDDWLVCMISSQIRQQTTGFDDMIAIDDSDFAESGLKSPSIIRVGRLLVVEGELIPGSIGSISAERLRRIRDQLAAWLLQA
jgi:mRNA interferase MazF